MTTDRTFMTRDELWYWQLTLVEGTPYSVLLYGQSFKGRATLDVSTFAAQFKLQEKD